MGASRPAQVHALLVKSAVYQRRNTATNVCLVLAPIFFCGLLALLQALANNLLLAQRINKCGCQCTQCCVTVGEQQNWTPSELLRIAAGEKVPPRIIRTERCNRLEIGYCERTRNATCRSYNDSACSLRFSSPRQAVFCAIREPSSWPAVMQTPRVSVRAGGSTTQWLPYTGSDLPASRQLAANLVEPPELPNLQALLELVGVRPLALLTLQPSQVLALVLPLLAPGGLVQPSGEAVDAAQLSRLGLTFGSALTSNNDYYLENAFINSNSVNSRLQLILPEGGCSALRTDVTRDTSLPLEEVLLRYYAAAFPLVVPPLLQLFNVTPSKLAGGLKESQVGSITASCVDTLPRELQNASALDRRLYCGFGVARCDGTYFTREYGGAWNFKELGPSTLVYDAYYNLSLPVPDTPVNYRISELLNMATNGWTRAYWGDLPITYTVRNRLMGLMSFPKFPLDLKLDFSVILGPLFYTWVIQMLLPSLLQQLVYEKEKRLRMMMKMHGLGDGAYWLVTYLWFLLIYIIYVIFFVICGTVIRLKIFKTSSLSLQAVLFFIFGNNMIAFIFMLSSLFSSSRTATVAAFLYIFATGLIGELLLRSLMERNQPYILAVQLIPGFALYRGLFEFSAYSLRALFADVPGLGWSNLGDAGNGLLAVWAILLLEWPIFMMLAWYFEQVFNTGTGARRHPLFFLRSLWKKPDNDGKARQAAARTGPPPRPANGASATNDVSEINLTPPSLVSTARIEGGLGEGAGPDEEAEERAGAAAAAAGGEANGSTCVRGAVPIAEGLIDSNPCGISGGMSGVIRGGGEGEQGDPGVADDEAVTDDRDLLPGRPLDGFDGAQCDSGAGRRIAQGSSRGSSMHERRTLSRGSGSGGGFTSNPKRCPADDDGDGFVKGFSAGAQMIVNAPPTASLLSRRCSLNRGSTGTGTGTGQGLHERPGSPDEGVRSGNAYACSRGGGSPPGGGSPSACLTPRQGVNSPVSLAWIAITPPPPTATGPDSSATSLPGGGADKCSSDGDTRRGGAQLAAAPRAKSPSSSCIRMGPSEVEDRSEAVEDDSRGNGASSGMGSVVGADGDGSTVASLGAVAVGRPGQVNLAPEVACPHASDGVGGGGGGDAFGLMVQAYDVAAEAARVEAMDEQRLADTPIVVRGLAKVFWEDRGGTAGDWTGVLGCGSPRCAHVAVRTLTLAIERGECFGLLGPNGAGKSTTIHILSGFLEPSGGDALVEGRSVRTQMPEIYRMMGVCPQDNLLWEQLTGEEHLIFYGRLKGLKGGELDAAVEGALKAVKLNVNGVGKRRVSTYSGGMKRRLTVAISFIGNPQVVYLDEPSTGLDPASRRALWDVVRANKAGRAIILTTHSMEEAEILCDRLGIFVDGQLVCIGNPREITSRYADYLVFTITVGPGHEDAAKSFVERMAPNSRLTYTLGSTFKYELPTTDVSLSAVFLGMVDAKAQMVVLDWGVANATLEEVFIKFARQIGVETKDQ